MLIEAKARKQKLGGTSAERFKFTPAESKTRLPVWVGIALTALFAYLKEATGGTAAEHASQDGAEGRPGSERAAGGPGEQIGADTNVTENSAGPDQRAPLPQQLYGSFTLSAEPPLTVFNPSRHFASGFRPLAPQVLTAAGDNDNRYHVRTSSPGAADASARELNAKESAAAATPAPRPSVPPRPNRAPSVMGPLRLNDVVSGQLALLTLGDLLLGAHDADDDALHVTNVTASDGELHHSADGWTVTNLAGHDSTVTISYDISDGETVIHQTAQFHVLDDITPLTSGADTYVGAQSNTQIDALEGDDVVTTGAGADTVFGGAGNDQIHGGAGNDVLVGGAGNDVIYGGSGGDVIRGGDGNDRIAGEDGNDFITGDAGNDTLSGGAGNDLVFGGSGNDLISGDAGNDGLDGGDGSDTLDYSASTAAVIVGLQAGLATGADIGTDNIAGFERVIGGSGGDQLYGGSGAETLLGGAGNDTIDGGQGDDTLDGGTGIDTLDYSSSTADLSIDLEAGTASGADIGQDTISGFEQVAGGAGSDLFIIGEAPTAIAGGAGEDTYRVDGPSADLQIVDFEVGDRIETPGYEVMDRPALPAVPEFADIYPDVPADNALPIKVHREIYDGLEVTVLEVRSSDGGDYDILVLVNGHHDLVYLTHPFA
ncbi:calcium-binding protein [Devosia sp.]|uniref:calcium-binding protein n=1 Tax=Devosia sp. TaxID=1871048 RepID=UPI003BABC7E3